MKIFVKTLKGTYFEIEVKPGDSVADVRKNTETAQGSHVYPATQQMLIHQGKVLKDATTLEENKVAEKSFVVIMLSKASGGPSMMSSATSAQAQPAGSSTPSAQPLTASEPPASIVGTPQSAPKSTAACPPTSSESDVYGQAASNLVAGSNLETTIQQIFDMGGGSWDQDTIIRALRAAYNNPERAVEYLYSGLPSAGSNASAGTFYFLCNSQQFQVLRTMVQANPQILQPMLQELGKQNPHIIRLIQEHQADFLCLINEPVEGEGNILGQLAGAMPRADFLRLINEPVEGEGNIPGQLAGSLPQAVSVTTEEREAIEHLEAMGFDLALVLKVFFACNKNEELAANYLLDHMHEFEE